MHNGGGGGIQKQMKDIEVVEDERGGRELTVRDREWQTGDECQRRNSTLAPLKMSHSVILPRFGAFFKKKKKE